MDRSSSKHKSIIGKKGEEDACKFLVGKGYQILFRNKRFGRSEVDIIARDNDEYVFVEVKALSNTTTLYPEQMIKSRQWASLQNAAERFVDGHLEAEGVRFDVIAIQYTKNKQIIMHHQDVILPMITVD